MSKETPKEKEYSISKKTDGIKIVYTVIFTTLEKDGKVAYLYHGSRLLAYYPVATHASKKNAENLVQRYIDFNKNAKPVTL